MKTATFVMTALLVWASPIFGQKEVDEIPATARFKKGASDQYLSPPNSPTLHAQGSLVKLQSIELVANSTGPITPRFIYKGTVDADSLVADPAGFTAQIGDSSLSSVSPNDGGQFYISQGFNTNLSAMLRRINNVVNPMYEIRFGDDQAGLAVDFAVTTRIYHVPFTVWDISGTPDELADDIQMIATTFSNTGDSTRWGIKEEIVSPWPQNPARESDLIYFFYSPTNYRDLESAFERQEQTGMPDSAAAFGNLIRAELEVLSRITINSLEANPLTTINATNGLRRPRAGTTIRWTFQIESGFMVNELYAAIGKDFTFVPELRNFPNPTFSVVSAPAGMTIDPNTGTLNWTPGPGRDGFHTLVLRATNSSGSIQGIYTIWVDAFPWEHREHNNNNTALSVFNSGVVGKITGTDNGTGFQFNGENGLFTGNVIIGQSETRVSGRLFSTEVASGSGSNTSEYGTESPVASITSPIAGFDQAFAASFNDRRAVNPIGVRIARKSYSKSTGPDDDYVILDYKIANTTPMTLTSIYVGLAIDWDVGEFANNRSGYDAERKLNYVFEVGGSNPNYYGVAALLGEVSGLSYNSGVGNDSELYNQMRAIQSTPTDTMDYRPMISVGPFDIPAGESARAVFAVLGGTDLADLQANADAARAVNLGTQTNNPPVVASLIPNQIITLGGAPFVRDLNSSPVVFTDPNGDALTYTASSSATATATANVAGSRLTVTPVSGGGTTITVTADDGKGGNTSTSFQVTVNRPPVVANAISDQNLAAGGATYTRDLNTAPAVFNDVDGDALTYTANSNASGVATASISGSTLTVVSGSDGSAAITVTANDGRGGTVSTIFSVTVGTTANQPPAVANAIADQTLVFDGGSFTRDLNVSPAVFNDPDGDALTYAANSSATNIATASISGSILIVAPVAIGSATITVTANDGRGGSTPTMFRVTVASGANQPPSITATPLPPQPSGQQITVPANITDDTGIASVTLNYRRGGEIGFVSVTMALRSGSTYEGAIPAGISDSRGMEYFIVATDVNGAQTRSPESPNVISLPILVSIETKPMAQPGGSAQSAYRLIAVPFRLDNASAPSVLEDDLGAYNNTEWRLFGLAAGEPVTNKSPYVEASQTGSFTPGRGLFLIVKQPNKRIDAGPGQSVRTDQAFSITLASGHNFIATPFNFNIPASKLRLQSGGNISLQTYNGSWGPANALSPWEGYYLANNQANTDVLLVNPNFSPGAGQQVTDKIDEGGWRIRILAQCSEAADTYNFAGVAASSADGYDDADLAEPPPIGEYVSVYFSHPEWQKPLSRFSDDIRSASNSNQKWRFVVESNITNEMVTLRFDGLKEIDPNSAVFLVDEALQYKQNLRENAVYSYQSRSREKAKEFTLIVGKENFISEQTANVQGAPENFVLEQNFPNPFPASGIFDNPETAIRFGLPQTSVVTIKIFDLAGHEVATLLDRVELPAGRHQRVWDGRDAQGRTVVSGIYFCRLTAGGFAKTVKLMVMR